MDSLVILEPKHKMSVIRGTFMVSPTLLKQKLALNLGLKSELNLGVVGGGRTGRKGDGDGDKSGEEGESEHDAVGVGLVVGGVSDEVGNELMAVGGGGGDLYQHATTTGCTVASHPSHPALPPTPAASTLPSRTRFQQPSARPLHLS